ncbi:MAG: class I tRNA ligase family protein, partial [Anaerolineae bacterium]|nr:class I tRNA ligase family protein [Anaerolineae bacterium]
MEFSNTMRAHRERYGTTPAYREAARDMLRMVAPFAPHIAEELWMSLGEAYSVHQQPWPVCDAALTVEETIVLVIQVNGKVRD